MNLSSPLGHSVFSIDLVSICNFWAEIYKIEKFAKSKPNSTQTAGKLGSRTPEAWIRECEPKMLECWNGYAEMHDCWSVQPQEARNDGFHDFVDDSLNVAKYQVLRFLSSGLGACRMLSVFAGAARQSRIKDSGVWEPSTPAV